MRASAITWLDHDPEQARRAAELIRALSERTTIDSIAVGSIRDGIAGASSLATSTIQTRVRYFLLVPWAVQVVARRRPRDRAQYDRFLADIETATITSLVAANPAEGGASSAVRRARRPSARPVWSTGRVWARGECASMPG